MNPQNQTLSSSQSTLTATPNTATHELVRTESGYAQATSERPTTRFTQGSRVRVLSTEAGYSRVECEGGQACYVPSDALRALQPTGNNVEKPSTKDQEPVPGVYRPMDQVSMGQQAPATQQAHQVPRQVPPQTTQGNPVK